MKIISLALSLTLALSPAALAGGSSTHNYSSIYASLNSLGDDATSNISTVKSALNYTGELPKDGPITLTRTVTDTDSSSTQSTKTTSVLTVNLVMKNGKIASVDASATRKSVTSYDGYYATYMGSVFKALGVKFENPATSDLGVSNIVQKSFDTSTPTPAAHTTVKNRKTPDTGTDTTKKPGTGDTTNAQQEVKVVSPSAP